MTKENSGDTLKFLHLANELGVDHVKVSCAVVSTDPAENAAYQTPFFDSVKAQVREGQEALGRNGFAIVDKVHLPDSEDEGFAREYTWCPIAHFLTVIAADQNVYTCQDKAYSRAGLLGSLRDRRFRDLWFSDEMRRRMAELDPSRSCRHHCVGHGKNLMLLDYFEADQDHIDFI